MNTTPRALTLGPEGAAGLRPPRLRGRVLTPRKREYEEARRIWDALLAGAPTLIVQCDHGSAVLSALAALIVAAPQAPDLDLVVDPVPPPVALREPTDNALSPREVEVLALIAEGKTNAQIAEALVVAPATASRHVHNILSKLGMSRRAEAAAYAAAHGLCRALPRARGGDASAPAVQAPATRTTAAMSRRPHPGEGWRMGK